MQNLTTLTVVEIDTLWAPLSYATVEAYWAEADARAELRKAERIVEAGSHKVQASVFRNAESAIKSIENRLPALHDAWVKADAAEHPFQAEWARRGGWTRAYLVTNTGGHVHRSTECSTCYPTTRFEWLLDCSGMDEAEIVELAGERACTVCYSSAPVDTLRRPTKLFGEAEKARQAEQAERAAKKAKAATETVTVPDYREYGDSKPRTKLFKTARAATNALASDLGSLVHYGTTHPSAQGWQANVAAIRAALAEAGVEFDYDAALDRARTKIRREHKSFLASAQGKQYIAQGLLDAEALAANYDPAKY